MTSSVLESFAASYSSPVETPNVPSRIAWSTRTVIARTSSGVACRFVSPMTFSRTVLCPTNVSTFTATGDVSSFVRYSPIGSADPPS